MVPPDSYGISRAPYYLGTPIRSPHRFGYGGLTHCAGPFQALRLRQEFLTPAQPGRAGARVPRPRTCNAYRLSHTPGLASSAFARHYSRNHMLFSLPVGTEMFHFPTFPPTALYIQAAVTGDEASRVSPFGNPRINVWLSTPRGLSQIPTSFFGSWCQGIHRVHLKT